MYDINLHSSQKAVGIAMAYMLDIRDSIPGREKNFSQRHSVQTDSGDHPASYTMGTLVKQPRREADHSPPSTMVELYLQSPMSSWRSA
jgi:hypothetical protein